MTQILGTKLISKCMYCGSNSYGNGCRYSSHKKHVHIDDSKRCIYCGSTSFGNGCMYNPFSKIHIHGNEYNTMVKESIHQNYMAALILNRINEPITESAAYKLGIINDEGRKVKDPTTPEELAAYTITDQFIFRLKRVVGESVLETLNIGTIIGILAEKNKKTIDPTLYEKELQNKHRIEVTVKQLKGIIAQGIDEGISKDVLETYLIESIIKDEN